MKMKYWFYFLIVLFSMHIQGQDFLQLGINQFKANDLLAATNSFRNALRETPQDPIALEYLGDIKFKQKEWRDAAYYFKKALKTDKGNAIYHFKYAGALGMKAKQNKLKAIFILDDIKEHLQIAADLDKTYIAPRMVMVELYMELPKSFGGGIEKAKGYAAEVVAIDLEKGKEAEALVIRLSK